MSRKRIRRSPFRLEANEVFEQTMKEGHEKVRAEYHAIKSEINQVLIPLYNRYAGQPMNRHIRADIKATIDDVIQRHHGEIREEVKRTSNEAAVIGFAALHYQMEKQSEKKIKLKAESLKTPLKNYTGRKLDDGLNYAHRIKRINDKMSIELTNKIGRGVTESEGWIKLEKDVEKTVNKMNRRTELLQKIEAERIQEEARKAAAVESEAVGVFKTKTWISMGDDRVRDTHEDLHGVTLWEEDEFKTPNGSAAGPHLFGVASEDNNCRCQLEYSFEEVVLTRDELIEGDSGGDEDDFKAWAGKSGYFISAMDAPTF